MSTMQEIITIGICALATVLTRFLPFLIFSEGRETPSFIKYLGQALPSGIFAMLVVYCLRSTAFLRAPGYGIPELIGIASTALLHLWKRRMLLSIASGTLLYMLALRLCSTGII